MLNRLYTGFAIILVFLLGIVYIYKLRIDLKEETRLKEDALNEWNAIMEVF